MTVTWAVLALATSQTLTFEEALEQARHSVPVTTHEAGIAARRSLAEAVPWLTANPSLFVQPGWRHLQAGGTGPELYVGVTQEVSLAGAGSARQRSALRETEADRAQFSVRLRVLRLTAARAWLSLWASQGALQTARDEHALTVELVGRVERGAAAGGFNRVDVAVTKAYAAEARLVMLSLEGERVTNSLALSRVLGVADQLPVAAVPLPVVSLPTVEGLPDLAQHSLPVRLAQAQLEAARAHQLELETTRGTSLQVGALGWREGGGDLAAVGTLQVTVPVFERSQRERSAAVASLTHTEGAARTALIEEQLDRRDSLHELEHTAEVRRVLEVDLLPALADAAEGLERRFVAGEATAQELVLARRSLVSTKAKFVRARAEEVFARFRVSVLSEESAP